MQWNLIADIGGTNARFAAIVDGEITHQRVFSTVGDQKVIDIIQTYASSFDDAPMRACLAVAGPISSETATITNANQVLKLADVQKSAGTENVMFINDFEAASWAMVDITSQDVVNHQGPTEPPKGNRVIIGAGTGLGVGTLVEDGENWTVVAGEGGHVGVSPRCIKDTEVFSSLAKIWPEAVFSNSQLRVEAEALLSGTGIPYLYQAVCQEIGVIFNEKSTREIFQSQDDIAAQRSVDIFQKYLASLAGDLAILNSAKGGVVFTGGVILKNPWLIDKMFIEMFNDGGRFTSLRRDIPIYVYQSDLFGLQGAANALIYKT